MSRHSPARPIRPEGVKFARGFAVAMLLQLAGVAVGMVLIIAVHVAVSGRI